MQAGGRNKKDDRLDRSNSVKWRGQEGSEFDKHCLLCIGRQVLNVFNVKIFGGS